MDFMSSVAGAETKGIIINNNVESITSYNMLITVDPPPPTFFLYLEMLFNVCCFIRTKKLTPCPEKLFSFSTVCQSGIWYLSCVINFKRVSEFTVIFSWRDIC